MRPLSPGLACKTNIRAMIPNAYPKYLKASWASEIGRRFGRGLLSLAFPPDDTCPVCGSRSFGHVRICDACWEAIRRPFDNICVRCGLPLKVEVGATPTGLMVFAPFQVCTECASDPPVFERARSFGVYEGRLREIILKLKYDREWHLFEPLGQAMVSVASLELPPADVVIPVPMHELKEIARGMNHAYGLAKIIANALGLPLLRDGLVRTKNTPPLSDLTKEERQRAITEGFRVPREMVKAVEGKRIWLVDDVLTTGATAGECSKMLLRAGAFRVCVIAAARSLKHI